MAHILTLADKKTKLDLDNLPATDAECTRDMLVACRDRIFDLEKRAEKKTTPAKKRKADQDPEAAAAAPAAATAAASSAAASSADATSAAPAAAAAAAPAKKKAAKGEAASGDGAFTAAELKKFKASLAKKIVREIKKTAHNSQKKPYSSVTEGIPSRAFGCALLPADMEKKSSSKQMEKYFFGDHEEVVKWLDLTENQGVIDGVKCDAKGWFFPGMSTGPIKCRVAFEELEVSVKDNSITLKARTFMV